MRRKRRVFIVVAEPIGVAVHDGKVEALLSPGPTAVLGVLRGEQHDRLCFDVVREGEMGLPSFVMDALMKQFPGVGYEEAPRRREEKPVALGPVHAAQDAPDTSRHHPRNVASRFTYDRDLSSSALPPLVVVTDTMDAEELLRWLELSMTSRSPSHDQLRARLRQHGYVELPAA